ncbi:MAG: cytochrome B [Cyclobacteriaceae bacterium]
MYTGLIHTHSTLRYAVLALLIVVIAKSLVGLLNNKPYEIIDGKLTLWLMIATHVQLLVGLVLFFVSPLVQFSGETMKDSVLRYWTVEHSFMMLIAIVLITMARTTTKKLTDDKLKHKRVLILTSIALVLIVVAIVMSGRGLLIPIRA